MANVIYPKWKEAVMQGGANSSLAGTVKAVLIDLADYTYNAAHDFMDDVGTTCQVGTPVTLGSKTFVNGLFDAADSTLTAVTGDVSEAILIFIDTGTPSTSRPVALLDTGVTGLPVTPNGGDIAIAWNASGIFQL
jgi:hypothetical protein